MELFQLTYLISQHELLLLDRKRPLEAVVHVSDDFMQFFDIFFDKFDACQLFGPTID